MLITLLVGAALAMLGFVLSEISGMIRHRRETAWDAQARREERNARNRQIRDDFQLKALVDLQDAVGRLLRTTEEIHWARRQASWSKPDQWFTTPDVVEDATRLDTDFFTTQGQISRLRVRIHGVEAGNFAQSVETECTKSLEAGNEARSSEALREARKRFDEFNRRVGTMMDKLWIEEEQS